mmetsp:Transcript_30657/g.52453  ORF Transcript_30657/g.52453 Transcript_30657/m.52453 type:complete len:207 (-) Transcript_30657:761-1381(-)
MRRDVGRTILSPSKEPKGTLTSWGRVDHLAASWLFPSSPALRLARAIRLTTAHRLVAQSEGVPAAVGGLPTPGRSGLPPAERSSWPPIWPTAMAVASTPLMSLGLSGTTTRLACFAISASSPTYFSARRCTIASRPPGPSSAPLTATRPAAVASAWMRVLTASASAISRIDSACAVAFRRMASASPCAELIALCRSPSDWLMRRWR